VQNLAREFVFSAANPPLLGHAYAA
jgi:hypothetical protein